MSTHHRPRLTAHPIALAWSERFSVAGVPLILIGGLVHFSAGVQSLLGGAIGSGAAQVMPAWLVAAGTGSFLMAAVIDKVYGVDPPADPSRSDDALRRAFGDDGDPQDELVELD